MIAWQAPAPFAWCGSRRDGLQWLLERVKSCAQVNVQDSISPANLDSLCQQHPQRLILAIDCRIDHPRVQLDHLRLKWPEIPLAIAVNNWHDGSRRTGLMKRDYLQLPWYRWWDTWSSWLGPHDPQLLAAWPSVVATSLQAACAPDWPSGAILGGCRQTVESWYSSLVGGPAERWTSHREFCDQRPNQHAAPAWILWDDTCVHAIDSTQATETACQQLKVLKELFPSALLIVATSLPRWDVWQQWMRSGAEQLIVKPAFGLSLARLLNNHFACAPKP